MHHTPTETRLRAVAISPGVALGRPCFCLPKAPHPIPNCVKNSARECERLDRTLTWMIQRLQLLAREAEAKLGSKEADVFHVHRMMLLARGLAFEHPYSGQTLVIKAVQEPDWARLMALPHWQWEQEAGALSMY